MKHDESVGFVVKTISNLIRRNIFIEKSDITRMQGLVIGYLYHNQETDVFQKDIEAQFNIRRSTATEILKLMEKNGLIEKKTFAGDARQKKLTLTKKSIDSHEKFVKEFDRIESVASKNLSREELDSFLSTGNKIIENLKEMSVEKDLQERK